MTSVLVISHLFPNRIRPGSGPFVADEIQLLSERFSLAVLAPVRWLPPSPLPRWTGERQVAERENVGGVPVWRPRVLALPYGGLAVEARLWPRRLWPIVSSISKGELKLVHGHFALPDGLATTSFARWLGIPSIVTLYGDDILAYRRKRNLRHLLRRVVTEADALVAVSEELRYAAIDLGANPATTTVIPSSVPSTFRRVPLPDARARLGIAAEEEWVVWVGSAAAKKRPATAIEAFARVAATRPSARLAMLGAGSAAAGIGGLSSALGLADRVRFEGYVDREQVAVWQSAADVVISSSDSEGTPNVLVEALSCGTPIAAFPIGGIPELVRATGAGTLSRDASSEGLAEAIVRELSLKRSRDSIIRSAAPFTRERTLEVLLNVYSSVLHA